MKTNPKIEKNSRLKLLASLIFLIAFNLNCNLFAQVSISGLANVCAGGSGYNYVVNGNTPGGYYTAGITWAVSGGVITSNPSALSTNVTVVWNNDPVNGNNTGNLSVTVTNFQNQPTDPNLPLVEQDSDNENVTITGVANAGQIYGPASVCTNHTATFYVNGIPGANSYQWTIPSGWSWVPNTSHTGPSIQLIAPAYASTNNNLSVVGKSSTCGLTGSAAAALSISSVLTPVLNLGPNISVFVDMPAFLLPVNYAGGEWTGRGVTREGYFNAYEAGVGDHSLTYTYYNGSCTVSKTLVINVTPTQYYMTALTFNGGQTATVPNNNNYSNIGSGDFAIETWVKIPPAAQGGQVLFANSDGDEGWGLVFFTNNNNQLGLSIQSTAPVLSASSIPNLYDDVCHHLVVTRKSGVVSFYADATLYSAVSGANNAGLSVNNNVEYTIGYASGFTGGANPLTGTMDELSFWNVYKSPGAVLSDYNNGPIPGSATGLIGYWNFNEGGVVVHDVSSVANNGVLGFTAYYPIGSNGAPTRVQFACYNNGEVGLHYDGSTKYAIIPSNNACNFGGGAFSLEAWASIEACNSCIKDQVLLSNKTNNNPTSGFVWYVKNGTNMVIEFANGGNPCIITSDPFPYGLNIYNEDNTSCENYGVVRDAAGNVTFYFSGIALQGNGGPCPANINTTENMFVGHHDIGADNHAEFKGNINEIRIWNTNRSAFIASNQNTIFNNSTSGLVGYYRIKETVGSQILTDNSATGNNGTLGNNTSVESVDPVRTFDYCYSGDRVAHNPDSPIISQLNTLSLADNTINVYPNPFNTTLNLVVNDANPGNYLVEIFDTTNRLIYTKTVDPNTSLALGNDLPNGLYLLKVTNSQKQSKTFKIIKSNNN